MLQINIVEKNCEPYFEARMTKHKRDAERKLFFTAQKFKRQA